MIDHAIRRTGLGGTDVAAILGLHPYRSALDVWAEKRGIAEPYATGLAAELGLWVEPWLADVYSRLFGVRLVCGPGTVRHPEHEWWVGTPDRLAVGHPLVIELKTVGLAAARAWGDPEAGPAGMPAHYSCQARWYAGLPLFGDAERCTDRFEGQPLSGQPASCTDVFPCFLAWADKPPTPYRVWRDERIEARLLEVAEDWWQRYVVAGVEPPADGSDSARRYLARAYPDSIEPLAPASDAAAAWAEELARQRAERDRVQAQVDELENRIKQEIGPREGIAGEGWKATWKADKRGVRSFRFNFKETT